MSATELLASYGPTVAAAGLGTGGAFGAKGFVGKWLDHRLATRRQSDNVAMELVQKLQTRVAELEAALKVLQHQLNGALQENQGLLWLLKFCPEERRAEAVADVERHQRETAERRGAKDAADLKGDARQAAQIVVSTDRIIKDGGL